MYIFFSRPQVQRVEFIQLLKSFFFVYFVPLSFKKKFHFVLSTTPIHFSSSLDISMWSFKMLRVAYLWRCFQFTQMTLHHRAYIFYTFHWELAFKDLLMLLCEHAVLGRGASVIALPAGWHPISQRRTPRLHPSPATSNMMMNILTMPPSGLMWDFLEIYIQESNFWIMGYRLS